MENRKKTIEVMVGGVGIGGKNPVRIQSMTNTDTADAAATLAQCIELIEAGSELVRITVNNDASARAVAEIRSGLDGAGYAGVPLVGCFHYNGHILLEKYPEMAKALGKYRVNPGNLGVAQAHGYNFEKIVKIAIENDKAIRIGVNWGSLDQDVLTKLMDENKEVGSPKNDREVLIDAIVKSTLDSAESAVSFGLPKEKIILSAKVSRTMDLIEIYERLSEECDYPLHLGLTEAGAGLKGVVSSSAATSALLTRGIGDTIRISLTPTPSEPRTREVEVCKLLLQSLELRHFAPSVTSCPGCGRTKSTYFQTLALDVNKHITYNMADWAKKYPGCETLSIAVMGCVVNGPGESKHADIGISLPGTFEKAVATVYIDGAEHCRLNGENITNEFIEILEDYIEKKFGSYTNSDIL
ncbi:MAG: flavodoxin-dependent (E)-4-hydroxy-3-methylbut-2-enyl-diphosphate synthase [Candidatus Peregrinibacteria bacterium]|nr:flavodoxin-dependent (E)-4-hydroxy-3-methylbut-2-enyl-diphosphate synthase [Candidatus Peregrinibacteria bacterium]